MKNFGKKEKNLNDISAIIDCLHDPRVQVNREEFLRNELGTRFSPDVVEKAIAENPMLANIPQEKIDKIANDVINFAWQQTKTNVNTGSIDEKAQIMAHKRSVLLIATQKLMYLYGFPQLSFDQEGDILNSETYQAIISCLGVMSGVEKANEWIHKLAPYFAILLNSKIQTIGDTKTLPKNKVLNRGAQAFGALAEDEKANIANKIVSIIDSILRGSISKVSFYICCNKLKNQLKNTALSNPEYKQDEKKEAPEVLAIESASEGSDKDKVVQEQEQEDNNIEEKGQDMEIAVQNSEVAVKEKKTKLTKDDIMAILDKLYAKSIDGIPHVSPPIEELANQYLSKNEDVKKAAKSFINYQIAKCTTSGFITGFGGLITLPITIPANISNVLYVQLRMIACLAHMGGYNLDDDQTQTLVYACLAGVSVNSLIKQAGIKVGTKLTQSLIKKIPGTVVTKINQKVGFRLLTKFGSKGVINMGKMIPVVGAAIGGGFDFVETKIIADRSYKLFVEGDASALNKADKEEDYKDMETEENVVIIQNADGEIVQEVAAEEVEENADPITDNDEE